MTSGEHSGTNRLASALAAPGEVTEQQLIEAMARRQLRQSSYPPVRTIRCRYVRGTLVLEGTVPSFYLKQVAQALVLHRLEGLVQIANQVDVAPGG